MMTLNDDFGKIMDDSYIPESKQSREVHFSPEFLQTGKIKIESTFQLEMSLIN